MANTTLRQGDGMSNIHTPKMNLEVYYEGQWRKFETLMKYLGGGKLKRGIKRDIAKGQRDFLTGMKKNLVLGLQSGGSSIKANWPALKHQYKDSKGLGVRSGSYLRALQAAKVVQKGYIVSLYMGKGYVSYRPQGKNGLSVGQYSLIFEKGNKSGTQQPRPLWATAYRFTGGNKGVLRNMVGAVGKRLSKMGIQIRVKDKSKKYIK